MKITSTDSENLALIYEMFVLENLTVISVVGGSPTSSGPDVSPNPDGYATGDNRIAKVIGKVQTRKGPIKRKKKLKKKTAMPVIHYGHDDDNDEGISDVGPLEA